jgi:hypothetical protein
VPFRFFGGFCSDVDCSVFIFFVHFGRLAYSSCWNADVAWSI